MSTCTGQPSTALTETYTYTETPLCKATETVGSSMVQSKATETVGSSMVQSKATETLGSSMVQSKGIWVSPEHISASAYAYETDGQYYLQGQRCRAGRSTWLKYWLITSSTHARVSMHAAGT
ncbi:hypothetical protein SARC_03198 [Sphaeroforma arctica JP610]|uniref:Uncharacterized protein n=1 Tax=Sphaeroforma arctica JP610 TaxID=667725 RepID=A0A0L0G6W5_9EUKA|nr:hypothetical protein SARC_03198 [Sphaeroforma arctica JP610]KNC84601.1 hypothetical protein SARC_03198 [Sphaeroforma arctica JP610]|eukprot:XP_014158503.1 hypothetical protein SARC_03198 [Sphaeroforma arctica JP610]